MTKTDENHFKMTRDVNEKCFEFQNPRLKTPKYLILNDFKCFETFN